MARDQFLIARGLKADLPSLALAEPILTTDEERLYIGGNSGAIVLPIAKDLYISVKQFNAIGDGVADDTQAFLDALASFGTNGGVLFIPKGTYNIASTLVLKSNVSLMGEGNATILKATIGVTIPLIKNETAFVGSARIDKNIGIYNLSIDGNKATRTAVTASLLLFAKCENIRIDNIQLFNCEFIGISDEGCKNTLIQNSVFFDNGRTTSVSPCIWAQSFVADTPDTFTENIVIDNCYFHDNDRSAILFSVKGGGIINNCNFVDCSESTIFISGNTPDTNPPKDIIINNIKIIRSILTDVAANGIEVELAENLLIDNFIIDGTDGAGISLLNCKDIRITNGVIRNTHQNPTGLPAGASKAGLLLGSSTNVTGVSTNIVIDNVKFIENQGVPTQTFCIATFQSGPTPPKSSEVDIRNNDFLNGFDIGSGAIFDFSLNGLDNKSRIFNNRGHDSEGMVTLQVQAPVATGNVKYTCGFIPKMIQIKSTSVSATTQYQCDSNLLYDRLGASLKRQFGATNSASAGISRSGLVRGSHVIDIVDINGTVIASATFVSIEEDGFTLNWDVVTIRPFNIFEIHP